MKKKIKKKKRGQWVNGLPLINMETEGQEENGTPEDEMAGWHH